MGDNVIVVSSPEHDVIALRQPREIVVIDQIEYEVVSVVRDTVLLVTAPGPIGPAGAAGATGPQGPAGAAGPGNLFVQNAAPSGTLPSQYLWVQTNLGVSGEDITFWVEDGDA